MALSLSPIQFRDAKLLYISFDDTRQEGSPTLRSGAEPSAPGDRFFALSVDRKLDYVEADEEVVCTGSLRFKWEIRAADENSPVIANIEGAMSALAACPAGLDEPEAVKMTLAFNTLSYIWSKLRTVVEQLSAQSTIGALSLPAIDPVQLVED